MLNDSRFAYCELHHKQFPYLRMLKGGKYSTQIIGGDNHFQDSESWLLSALCEKYNT